METILLIVLAVSVLSNVLIAHKLFKGIDVSETVRDIPPLVIELLQDVPDPDPVVDRVIHPESGSVTVDPKPSVQAWNNQSGIPMVASNDSFQHQPAITPQPTAPLERPYGFV